MFFFQWKQTGVLPCFGWISDFKSSLTNGVLKLILPLWHGITIL